MSKHYVTFTDDEMNEFSRKHGTKITVHDLRQLILAIFDGKVTVHHKLPEFGERG